MPHPRRIEELSNRFGVHNGRLFAEFRFKNLNWYLCNQDTILTEGMEWFSFGDICDQDIPLLMEKLIADELLVLGWKDMSPNEFTDKTFNDGGGVRMVISNNGVLYDQRRDYPSKFGGL